MKRLMPNPGPIAKCSQCGKHLPFGTRCHCGQMEETTAEKTVDRYCPDCPEETRKTSEEICPVCGGHTLKG